MPPASFAQDLSQEWDHWVLEHGLPPLPGPQIAVGESVPVACWIGPTTAAVLHIRRVQDEDDPEPFNEVDVALYRLVDGSWEGDGGGGAGGWSGDALAQWQLPARAVALDGKVWAGDVTALWGEVGVDAAFAEVEQDGVVTRHPVVASTGHYVVSADVDRAFTVRVFDAGGQLFSRIDEDAGSVDVPPWM